MDLIKTVDETAKSLNISKESVYKKIKQMRQNELHKHIYKNYKGKMFISSEGEKIILQSLRNDEIKSNGDSNISNLENIQKEEFNLLLKLNQMLIKSHNLEDDWTAPILNNRSDIYSNFF